MISQTEQSPGQKAVAKEVLSNGNQFPWVIKTQNQSEQYLLLRLRPQMSPVRSICENIVQSVVSNSF